MSVVQTVRTLLADLKEINCRIWVEGGDLMVRTTGSGITPTLKAQLQANKQDIIAYLTSLSDAVSETRMASTLETRDMLEHSIQLPALVKQEQVETYELSYGQKAFWFLYLNAPKSPAYNVTMHWRILSYLHVPTLKLALQTLVDRHPSLRSTFSVRNGEPMQTIHPHQSVCFEEFDVVGESDEQVYQRARASYLRLFDLENGPLLRASLFKQAVDKHILLITTHHIISDGWSFWNLMSEFLTLYPELKAGKPANFPPLTWQYQDFVSWQSKLVSSEGGERLWKYWQKQLAEQPPSLDLPADRQRTLSQSNNGASIIFTLPKALTQKLKTQARTSGHTLYVMLVATFQVLLHRYTGQNDIWVGSAAAGRSLVEFKDICGCFFNFIVLRAKLDAEQNFALFLRQVQKNTLEALAHQDYPSLLLIERLKPRRDSNSFPLFQVEFNLQQPQEDDDLAPFFLGADESYTLKRGELTLKPFRMTQQEGQFDLSIDLIDVAGESLSGICRYNSDLFDACRIKRLLGHYETLLEAVAEDPQTKIAQLPLLTPPEQQQLLQEWSNIAMASIDAPQSCVHTLFEQQAVCNPDAIALTFRHQQISYGELNVRANRLAHYLRMQGVGPEIRVGLFLERSIDVVVGLMAILKAGGAYVPLDPDYPLERLSFMVEDADLRVLVCHDETKSKLPKSTVNVLDITAETEVIARQSSANPETLTGVQNLAYIIYTSGSTGKPKGVCVEHRNVVRLFQSTEQTFHFGKQDVWTLFHSHAFDFSVWEIWGALIYGGSLVIVPYMTTRSPSLFYELLIEQGVTVLNQTPSAFYQLIEYEQTLHAHIAEQRPTLVNMYGITETTVHVTLHILTASDTDKRASNIGKPVSDLNAYILDQWQQPVPIGIPGELYVGGGGVTRGYFNRPELTAERFIEGVFKRDDNTRLYRTGDLCRWLPDGDIEYLGRVDTQVKIRGFRIECGEIENTLRCHAHIQDAVVGVVGEDDNKQLVAWLVGFPITTSQSDEPLELAKDELRAYLRTSLPEWMLPSRFVLVEDLPLTPSGKVDRKALSASEITLKDVKTDVVLPETDLERTLADIWCELLTRKDIGIHENFFEAGGNSMSIVRLQSKLREQIDIEVAVAKLFANPTIYTQARYLTGSQHKRTTRSRAGERRTRQELMKKQQQARQQRRSSRQTDIKC
ncbi:amino acid adenylation domain-containing protein [Pseudoalteromonas prydzensis]|uniref:amino acid adenylation domain-containing protein n=1 Tax=Pseudoalteromonas prydzensis TaxID=182141 RepID=UPI003FCF6E41